jgi:hypothetical protein
MSQVILKPIAKPPNKPKEKLAKETQIEESREANEGNVESVANLSPIALLSPIEIAKETEGFISLNEHPRPSAPLVSSAASNSAVASLGLPPGATLLHYSSSPSPSPLHSLSPTSLLAIFQRKTRHPPVPKSNSYKSVKEYTEMLSAENEGYISYLQSVAGPLFQENGPLCDSEGFYQHSGECWNDAFQQVLFNTDMIKEQIQGMMMLQYNFSENYIALPDTLFVPLHKKNEAKVYIAENKEEIDIQKEWAILYLQETQKRFLRHYILEALRRKIKQESCAANEPAEVAREKIKQIGKIIEYRKKGKEGQRSAIFGKLANLKNYAFRPTIEEYVEQKLAGGTEMDIQILLNIINFLFFSPQPIEINYQIPQTFKQNLKDIKTFNKYLERVNSCIVGTISTATKNPDGHELAFYQCGNDLYLYDSNDGAIQFDWRSFLLYFLNLILKDLNPLMLFCSIQLYNESELLSFDFYPIIQYEEPDKSGITSLILIKDDIIDISKYASDRMNPNFIFNLEIDDGKVKGEINRAKHFIFETITFLKSPLAMTANAGFKLNYSTRLKRSLLEKYIILGNEEKALEYIEKEPVVPNLKGITYLGDVPILYIAIQLGHKNIAMKLLEKGYNFKYEVNQSSPLMHSIEKNLFDVFLLLLKMGVDISFASTNLKRQAIHVAVSKDIPIEYLQTLVEAGADINAQTSLKSTPLIIAAAANEVEKIKYLCSKGADTSIIMMDGKSVFDFISSEEAKAALESCAKKGGKSKKSRKYQTKKRKYLKKQMRFTRVKTKL